MKRTRRSGAMIAIGALLASLTAGLLAAPASAGPACTFDMTAQPGYDPSGATTNFFPDPDFASDDHVLSGQVVCGGPGDDHVFWIDAGGVFKGKEGGDRVIAQNHGRFIGGPGLDAVADNHGVFIGGPGSDKVRYVRDGGIFYGNGGPDHVNDNVDDGGTFVGGKGNDTVGAVYGVFRGAKGADHADAVAVGGRVVGGPGNDRVNTLGHQGTFFGNAGRDEVGWAWPFTRYNGGPGWDVIEIECGGGGSTKSVEQIKGMSVCS